MILKLSTNFNLFQGRVGEGDVSVENSWIFEVDGEIVKCLDCVKFLGTHEVSIFQSTQFLSVR